MISGVFRRDLGVTAGFLGFFHFHRNQKEKQNKFEPLKGVMICLLYSAHPNLVGLCQILLFLCHVKGVLERKGLASGTAASPLLR